MQCVICQLRDPFRPAVCDVCRCKIAANFAELRDYTPLLSAATGPDGNGAGERVSGSRDPSAPVRLDVVDLTLSSRAGVVRDRWGDQRGQVPIAAMLDSWVAEIRVQRAERSNAPAPTAPVLAGWLYRRTQWICDHFAPVADLHDEVRLAVYAVRRVLHLSRPPIYLPIACPSPTCRAVGSLRYERGATYVECGMPSCNAAWTADELRGRLTGDDMVESH